jgi:cholesterol oxidase
VTGAPGGVGGPRSAGEVVVDGLSVCQLRRFENRGPAVLLLHGGNTSGDTFLHPEGGLAGYLARREWDVWIADWRGSPHVLPQHPRDLPPFTVDTIANEDFPALVAHVRREVGPGRHLAVVAHCLSGCAFALAIARGHLGGARDVDAIVLTTLGLFFESCWDGWLKAEDFILERILAEAPDCWAIDPERPGGWPAVLRDAFAHWPRAWLPRPLGPRDPVRELTFMFGRPYRRRALHPEFGVAPTGRAAQCFAACAAGRGRGTLAAMFGPMPFGMYQHVAQMIRRGFAAPFDALDVLDRPRVARGATGLEGREDDLDPGPFRGRRLTLLGGAENQLWHRDSLDLMYDWLRSAAGGPGHRFAKHVLPGYGHQDLFWGHLVHEDVYWRFESALGP